VRCGVNREWANISATPYSKIALLRQRVEFVEYLSKLNDSCRADAPKQSIEARVQRRISRNDVRTICSELPAFKRLSNDRRSS
jgi:hypothetical protein